MIVNDHYQQAGKLKLKSQIDINNMIVNDHYQQAGKLKLNIFYKKNITLVLFVF